MAQIEVEATIRGMDELAHRVDVATSQIAAEVAHRMQAQAMVNAPVGTVGNSTNAPGDLKRSIDVQGPDPVEAGRYVARVGPTVIYGRQRELGGHIYPQKAKALKFTKFGVTYVVGPTVGWYYSGRVTRMFDYTNTIFVPRAGVYQYPHPYLKPAYEEIRPSVSHIARDQIREAVAGA